MRFLRGVKHTLSISTGCIRERSGCRTRFSFVLYMLSN
jgi:hypothetical protein